MNVEKMISRYEKKFISFAEQIGADEVEQIVEIGRDSLFETAIAGMKFGFSCGYYARKDRNDQKDNPELMELIKGLSGLDKDTQAAVLPVILRLTELLKK